jgi:hypothetical protein
MVKELSTWKAITENSECLEDIKILSSSMNNREISEYYGGDIPGI